jgi:hypothetical protein
MNPMANFVNNSTNPVNMETNMNINTNTSINLNTNTNETKDYKDIKSYNPTGGLVYKEQLLQDLHRKLKLK